MTEKPSLRLIVVVFEMPVGFAHGDSQDAFGNTDVDIKEGLEK